MWKTTNYLGKEVIWYSQEEVKEMLADIKEIVEWHTTKADSEDVQEDMKQILQKINEVNNDNIRNI